MSLTFLICNLTHICIDNKHASCRVLQALKDVDLEYSKEGAHERSVAGDSRSHYL